MGDLRNAKRRRIANAYRKEVRVFSASQIALMRNFAAQAVIAIENMRPFDEVQARTEDLRESLKQQTAITEVLEVINKSPGSREAGAVSIHESCLLERAVRDINAASHHVAMRQTIIPCSVGASASKSADAQ